MQAESAPPDKMVARIAARQHGVITFGQLLGAGLSKGGVLRRERRGWLHRIHRGVYAVGHPSIGAEGRYMAAVLACGRGTTLSHRSAAGLWLLLPAALGDVHVIAAGRGSRRFPERNPPASVFYAHRRRHDPEEGHHRHHRRSDD